MTRPTIRYRAGYKYQLAEDYEIQTDVLPARAVNADFIKMDLLGTLRIVAGYAWDGPSGPAQDTPDFMRASLVHDALYQLMREGYLDPDLYRERADAILRTLCIEDGMPHAKAEFAYLAVRAFGKPSTDPKSEHPIIEAPGITESPQDTGRTDPP